MRDLIALEKRYRASASKTEALRRERNEAILAALEAGHSQSDIADALGLTRSRISQLVMDLTPYAAR